MGAVRANIRSRVGNYAILGLAGSSASWSILRACLAPIVSWVPEFFQLGDANISQGTQKQI